MSEAKNIVHETLKVAIPTYGLGALVFDQIVKSVEKSRIAIESNDSNEIESEINRKKAETQIYLLEAKIAQEFAIAKRIEEADIVEIEEYYEKAGKGNLGVSVKENVMSAGVSAEGQNVTKRIYRFIRQYDDSMDLQK
jgi:hypothetical protein